MGKNKGGAPIKYHDEVIDITHTYFAKCERTNRVPSMAGLAREIGVVKSTLENWSNTEHASFQPGFLGTLRALMDLQEDMALNNGANGKWNSTIAKLLLANHGYSERSAVDHTSGGEKLPTPILGLNVQSNDSDDETE
jgi:hypothetical protein